MEASEGVSSEPRSSRNPLISPGFGRFDAQHHDAGQIVATKPGALGLGPHPMIDSTRPIARTPQRPADTPPDAPAEGSVLGPGQGPELEPESSSPAPLAPWILGTLALAWGCGALWDAGVLSKPTLGLGYRWLLIASEHPLRSSIGIALLFASLLGHGRRLPD
jgi:hypothetical protein